VSDQSEIRCVDSEFDPYFRPLAPQLSPYWVGAWPQSFDSGDSLKPPLPPLPILGGNDLKGSIESSGSVGSGISLADQYWVGEPLDQGNGVYKWGFYCSEWGGFQNHHNYFQYAVGGGFGSQSSPPPAWNAASQAGAIYEDWVDVYGPYLSRAYFDDYAGYESLGYTTAGFGPLGFPRIGSPQHVDLPPNYPPVSTDAWSSNSPLVPASGGAAVGSYFSRELVGERLDILTGEPLLSEVDLELPFGGAVFRRIRTYSEHPDHGIRSHDERQWSSRVESWSRGWHGSGWMSSEMPLFYFEASQKGTITTGEQSQIGPVCYFAPDAHYSIPFIQQDRNGSPPDYIAPDWYDAMLLYDKEDCEWGEVDGGGYGWIIPPTEFQVYLHDRSVIYSIRMIYEDVDPLQHKRPVLTTDGQFDQVGFGVPYYGLVSAIHDRSGNTIRITYADSELHKPFMDPDPAVQSAAFADPENPVIPVRQHGWYKGMIDHIKLYASGESEASWSLFYTYRTFLAERGNSDTGYPEDSDNVADFIDYWDHWSHAPVVHSILVYERDVSLSELGVDRKLILDSESVVHGPEGTNTSTDAPFSELLVKRGVNDRVVSVFAKPINQVGGNQFDYQDEQIGPTGEGDAGLITRLPNDWVYNARFSYAEPASYGEFDEVHRDGQRIEEPGVFEPIMDYTIASCGPVQLDSSYFVRRKDQTSYLLKSALWSRLEDGEGVFQTGPPRIWLYRYQDIAGPIPDRPHAYSSSGDWDNGATSDEYQRRLSHRFGPETFARIYKNRPNESEDCDPNSFANGLIAIEEDRGIEGRLCGMEPNPGGGFGDPMPSGKVFGLDDENFYDGTQFDGTPPGRSATHSLDDEDTNIIPVGLLADTIYYRWSEAYRLDPRLFLDDDGEVVGDEANPIARPSSWELFDGRIGDVYSQSAFQIEMRQDYVGGSVSTLCEDLTGLNITQAEQSTTGFLPGGTGLYSTIGTDGSTKWFRIYRFISAPEDESSWRGTLYSGGQTPPEFGSSNYRGPEVIWDPSSEFDDEPSYDDPDSIPANSTATQALYYYPYNFVSYSWGGDVSNAGVARRGLRQPMWWVVVDEYNSIEDALDVNSSLAYPEGEESPSNYIYSVRGDQDATWNNRRVVSMNSAGAILSDRTWTSRNNSQPQTQDPPAVLEAWSYDQYLRPLIRYTRGWGAAAADAMIDESSTGLVEVYEYPDAQNVAIGSGDASQHVTVTIAPRTPTAKWLRKGCGTTNDLLISTVEYTYDPDALVGEEPVEWVAKLPKHETYYDLGGNEIGTVDHFIGHWDLSDIPVSTEASERFSDQPPMRYKIRAGPVHKRHPLGADVRAIEASWYDHNGRLVWRADGAMEDPEPINEKGHLVVGDSDEIFLNYYQYDEHGRQTLAVEDIAITESGVGGFSANNLVFPGRPGDFDQGTWDPTDLTQYGVTDPRGNLFIGDEESADDLTGAQLADVLSKLIADRIALIGTGFYRSAKAEPLNAVTFRAFNRFGEYKVVHPNGLRSLTSYELESEYMRELRAMDVDFDPLAGSWSFVGQNLFDSSFEGGSFAEGIQGTIDELLAEQWNGSPYEMDDGVFDEQRLEVIAKIEPSYDTAGRLTGLRVADEAEPAEPLASSVAYDGWGNTLLEISPEWTIKRNRYDGMGRLHKTFIGSSDRHHRWRTADNADEDDDLILSEKYFYGTSPNDASLPISKWTYRQRSDTQYEDVDWWEPSDDRDNGQPAYPGESFESGLTSQGRVEIYGYDWRMRRVITKYKDFYDGNSTIYREERSFLDNLDRVRFVAVYEGEAGPMSPDPDIGPGQLLPAANDFLGDGVADNLLSLDETVYNDAGQVVERRRYDPTGAGGYLVSHSYTDHANRAIWSSTSAGEVSHSVYDAKGRLAWTSTYAGDDTAGGIEMQRTVNTYGPDGRVESSITIERRGDQFTGAVPSLENSDRRVSAQYTWYDSAGRVIATADLGSVDIDADGTQHGILPSRPDASPEVVEKISEFAGGLEENRHLLVGVDYPDAFFDTNGRSIARLSCYWYDRLGKQNAVLRVNDCFKDTTSGTVTIAYTIDRSEYNRYGQRVLEHSYGYEGPMLTTGLTAADFELLRGTEYTFSDELTLEGQGSPTTIMTTQVRTITPLVPSAVSVEWDARFRVDEYDDDGDGETDDLVARPDGLGRFVPVWNETSARRVVRLEYNAPIVQPAFDLPGYILNPVPNGPGSTFPVGEDDWGYLGISNRPDLLKAMHLPNPNTGGTGSGTGYSVFFFYYPDGLPAIRVDSRGISVQYIYDADGNLTRISTDDHNIPLVADLGMSEDQLPSNAIDYVYDALSRLEQVTTSRVNSNGPDRLDTVSTITYGPFGEMLSETQQRPSIAIPSNQGGSLPVSGTVSYAWQTLLRQSSSDPVGATNNVHRLQSITYPPRSDAIDGRVVTLGYGQSGSVSDLINRVESLTSSGGASAAQLGHIATYRYDGLHRLAGIDLGEVPGEPALTYAQKDKRSFDRFGRVNERTIDSFDLGTTQYRSVINSEFGYTLRGDRVFELLTQRDHQATSDRSNTHSGSFRYDALGRLVDEQYGVLLANGFAGIDVPASTSYLREMIYTLDSLNRRVGDANAPGISIWEDTDGDTIADPPELFAQTHELDARGGLTGLNDGTITEPVDQDVAGAITQLHGRQIYYDWLARPVLVQDANDNPVFAVSYDGFGRVATRSAIWPGQTRSTVFRHEAYFYDGVRRIQEVFVDPVDALPPWPVEPGEEPAGSGSYELRTEAEYIWSASSAQPFDTCHVQVDWWGREAWLLQDHSTVSVRGYTDANGELVEQYRLDAYGNVFGIDKFTLAQPGGLFEGFRQRLGHHGLFIERVDSTTLDPVIAPGSELWALSRSRWYAPELGRFLTSDPNETGVPTVASLAMLGKMPAGPPSGSFDWESHFGDGLDTFTAYGANPIANQDPTGLFFLIDLSGGGVFRSAGKAYGAYDKAEPAVGLAKNVISGISLQQAMLIMVADLAFEKAGGELIERAIGGASRAGRLVRQNRLNGMKGESVLRDFFGGAPRSFSTSDGRRFVDNVVGRTAQESKVGRVGMSSELLRQMNKDVEIKKMYSEIGELEWHFFKSPTTGKIGPTASVESKLRERGIRIVIHDTIKLSD